MIDTDCGIEQEFPDASTDAWLRLLAASSNRASTSNNEAPSSETLQAALNKLSYSTLDGLTTRPLYTRADLPNDIPLASARRQSAHHAQYTDGSNSSNDSGIWDIRQKVRATSIKDANRLMLSELSQGATSVHLFAKNRSAASAENSDSNESSWIAIDNHSDADALTDGVYLELITLSIEPALPGTSPVDALRQGYAARNLSGDQIRLALNHDWLSLPSQNPQTREKPSADELSTLGNSITKSTAAEEQITHLAVDLRHYHNLGCTRIEEIAIACASGLAYLKWLRELGITLEQANRQIVFHVAIDHDFFANIIKLRALRETWCYLLTQSDSETDKPSGILLPNIHAHTSLRMLSLLDTDNNQLRNTIACAAAAIGGADSISVEPHRPCSINASFPAADPDEDARRLARNIQHILMQESNLYRVQDPIGGSPFAESQTTESVEKAWQLLQEIESSGGIEENLDNGSLLERIAGSRQKRSTKIAHRTLPLVGVSEFAAAQELHLAQSDACSATSENTDFRDSAAFESLRAQTCQSLNAFSIDSINQSGSDDQATNKTIACHLICFGKPAIYRARAGFARNLVSAIGLTCSDIVLENAIEPDTNPKDWLQAQLHTQLNDSTTLAPICVLCGDDDSYRQIAAGLTQSLKRKGTNVVVLAGKTSAIFKTDDSNASAASDWDHDMFAGCDVIALANNLQQSLGKL